MTLPAAERGATRIADRVVAKIASRAAREALDGAAGRGASGATEAGPPYADVTVRGDVARVRVAVELGYPSDIGALCGAVRRRITERVNTLAGMEVPEVAVVVERLHSVHMGASGRVR
ncbi:Asp23/Gls24 family envelope stress response protein [Streptomyces sp. NPDC008001]|uniref:Asp23/Gls24 family envelope stress response protein n=1 Tax=Streptomyces sp. NPDC008001 TaxID=3364804 RepID=UPI0036E391FE